MMKSSIVLFAYEFPPCSGGIARLCAEISKGYRKAQRNVRVLTQRQAEADLPEAVPPIRVPANRPRREWSAFRWLRQQPVDMPVVCGLWYPEGLIASLSGMKRRVVLAHGNELFPPVQRWRRPLWAMLQRWVLENASLVVANSEYTRRLVLTVAPRARVESIPLAVDHERFTPGDRALAKQKLKLDGKQVLCTVARIQRYKGHEVVLRALSRLSPHERAAMAYLVVGTGPHRQELQRLAIQLGVDSIVRWCAFVPEEELSLMYQASDLFVLCTQEAPAQRVVEGFGLVFLEAQACGTPVVGTRTGGIGDAVKDGDGGWLIEQDDSAALSGILRRLVSSPDIFHAEGERARKRVLRECTWERYVGRFSAAVSRAMVKYE